MNTPTTNSPLTWELPSKKAIRDAITYFVQRPKNAPYLTLQFKLHNPSAYKKRVLLEAHVAITNMLAELVAHFYEYPEHPRLNGIVATLFNAKKSRSDGKVAASSLLALIHSTVKAFNIKPIAKSKTIEPYQDEFGSRNVGKRRVHRWAKWWRRHP
ncbi:MAG: hypothetical protein KAX40_03030 [Herpetosiphon sp.]|nr:hypothetical protein [Herpetosiphon sp.]